MDDNVKVIQIEERAFEELLDLAEEAMGYMPEYFLVKWKMRERLQSVRVSSSTTHQQSLDADDAAQLAQIGDAPIRNETTKFNEAQDIAIQLAAMPESDTSPVEVLEMNPPDLYDWLMDWGYGYDEQSWAYEGAL